jgi:hypothetical protein
MQGRLAHAADRSPEYSLHLDGQRAARTETGTVINPEDHTARSTGCGMFVVF